MSTRQSKHFPVVLYFIVVASLLIATSAIHAASQNRFHFRLHSPDQPYQPISCSD